MNIKNSFKHRIIALVFLSSLVVFSRCKKDSLEETQIDAPQSEVLTDSATVTSGNAEAASTPASTEVPQTTPATAASPVATPAGSEPSSTSGSAGDVRSKGIAASGITSSSYYLEKSLPSGYVKDGSKDYTSYVQAAVSRYSNIVFPAFPILVNDKGINIASNKVITFLPGSQVLLKGSSKAAYNIFNISGASNITLYNPVIVGDRSSHTSKGGEAGMGIAIRGSNNVTLYNAQISNCWGDGIYIGQTNSKVISKNIVIKDATLRKNRRDGISIIAVDGLLMDNVYAGFSDGTAPMCGINFEPNNPACEIKNVRINNPKTEANENGIQVGTKRMIGSSNKNTDITITNHVDEGSTRYAVKLMCNPSTSGKQNGLVNIINPTWNRSKLNIPLYLNTNQANFKTAVSSPAVTNTSGTVLPYAAVYTMLMTKASSSKLTVTN